MISVSASFLNLLISDLVGFFILLCFSDYCNASTSVFNYSRYPIV
jgi:hypothetical protein